MIIVFVLLLCLTRTNTRTIQEYKDARANILLQESLYTIGAELKLTPQETFVNNVLMQLKREEMNQAFYHPEKFNLTKHYFAYKDYLKTSKVYQIIREMPKGAALHLHRTFMLDKDFLLQLTYESNLYICMDNNTIRFQFSDGVPSIPCPRNWELVSELRKQAVDVTAFDYALKQQLTMETTNQKEMNAELTTAWAKFDRIHKVVKSLTLYRPVQEKCILEILQTLYCDNIMYAEIRNGLQSLYELNGTVHDHIYTTQLYNRITEEFKKEYPNFIGVKHIITKARTVPLEVVNKTIQDTTKLKKMFPDSIIGFDLVGQEDVGFPLKDYLPVLLEAKDDIDFYFHAGETNWFGTTTDENLLDAILLGTKRIGHGFALAKHPVLMSMVKKQNIAVEVNVISNAVLALVSDIRNHPLAQFMSLGLPIVLSSDDPGVWGAEPLSHDFYIAFVAVASKYSDLRFLKQLALNSIKYSALKGSERDKMFNVFNKRWNSFITKIMVKYRHKNKNHIR